MSLDIDPTQITQDNVPQVLGAIVVELQNMNHKLDEHMEELTDSVNERINALTERVTTIEENNVVHPNCTTHLETLKRLDGIEKTLQLHDTLFWTPLLVTKDDILPFIWKYKYAVAGTTAIITMWWALTDWAVRAIQWGLVPPGQTP
jgi:hypothetical protein